ncbi:hypothetical protein Tco_1209975 [Tanacetum coccineum]
MFGGAPSSCIYGLISASSACASFPDMLLVSCSLDSVPMLSVLTKLASTAFPYQPYPLLSESVFHSANVIIRLCCALSSIDFLTDFMCWISVSRNSGILSRVYCRNLLRIMSTYSSSK